MSNHTLWGIHAGRTGDADTLFINNDVVALGWHAIGDLTQLKPTREAFKEKYAQTYVDAAKAKPGTVPTSAGQLYRFAHEMKEGDLVAYPSKKSKLIHLGRITSSYKYDGTGAAGYPQRRSVRWLKAIPRSHFSQGALYEIGSALSVFVIKNYAEEFLSAIEASQEPPAVPVISDDSVEEISQDIEENTRDFVLKILAQQTKGHPFADFVANLLQTMGYRTRVSAEGPDGGIDIVAHKDELGFEPPIIKVQCKSSEGGIGDPLISQLYGKVAPNEFGLFVTLGYFTNQAIQFARSKSNLRLIDGDDLVALILEHYEALDSKYKGLIPLRRVYIPAPAPNAV
ncbi:restriction endonuclease [Duganella qianjiadongensis]|uniref:Restriction endonuclease n=1 Tax=Duganella qianjiadongensis TaxID=2692176 RepID=A0ABW9VSX4_9BURK|nr:restriction endonuclease [Duganella qianjiadongensis]MYM42170.1 restriction endonuclease [Duganella qianjiadongensis]